MHICIRLCLLVEILATLEMSAARALRDMLSASWSQESPRPQHPIHYSCMALCPGV